MNNLLKTFFARDNATRSVAGFLLTAASLLTLAEQHHLIPDGAMPATGVITAVLATVAAIVSRYAVFTWGLALTALYAALQTLIQVQGLPEKWHNLLAFAVGAVALLQMKFSEAKYSDVQPPQDTTTTTYTPRRLS
jgi:hypothetical protein